MVVHVWAIVYDTPFSETLYQSALLLVDPDSQAKINKFHRREDASRCLIGRLLPRMLLKQRGIAKDAMHFAYSEAGKPYFTTTGIDPPIGFNVSHDQEMIAMAFGTGDLGPPAYTIGVDVMRVHIPSRETFSSFVDSVGSQLTELEHRLLSDVPEDEALRRFFWIWTLKESYTKALGHGLGFDFRRIEYDVYHEKITIDGETPLGWQFFKFELAPASNLYVGVAAKFIGGRSFTIENIPDSCLVLYDAVSFVNRAIEELN